MQEELKNHVNTELVAIKMLLTEQINTLHDETMLNADRMRDSMFAHLDEKFAVMAPPPHDPPR